MAVVTSSVVLVSGDEICGIGGGDNDRGAGCGDEATSVARR